MAIFLRRERYNFSRSQTLASVFFKKNYCALAQRDMGRSSDLPSVDTSKWRKVSASVVGIKNGLISSSSWTVLKVLRQQGFEAYLVGGCVRDLILHRVPKDFDVITTADLKKIRRQFNRAQIIGKRFPICHVWIRGSMTEVSSFDTVALVNGEGDNCLKIGKGMDGVTENGKENEKHTLPKVPHGCSEKDINRWRNSMHRDFTINSLFFDPFDFKIYDYANGIEDLKARKLRTIIPAQVSFEEDCARILRGLRIAARLNLSFSKDIETAIPNFVSSVASLDPFRLMMEMNYMLSYGAAWPSILLLRKFNLLQQLLPFQAAYLEQASRASPLSSTMLMRLFSNMDKLVSCKRPGDCKLWIALLAFHTALVRDPQDALVVSAFASVLCHGSWKEAVRYARAHENSLAKFAPEIPHTSETRSDADLAEAVAQFTFLFQESVSVLSEMEDLQEVLSRYPDTKCSGRVFISQRKAREVAGAFDDLVINLESYESKREGSINYLSLGKGDPCEIRFVLGKIILDTMSERVIEQTDAVHSKGVTKMRHVPPFNNGNEISTLYNTFKNRNQSWVHKHGENHSPEASVPKPMQKASKWPRPDDSTAKIQRVLAVDKEHNSTVANPGNGPHQPRVQKKTSKGLNQGEGMNNQKAVASLVGDSLKAERNISSDNSVSKLLHKLVGISERMISKNKEHDPEALVLKPKQKTSESPEAAVPKPKKKASKKRLKEGEGKNNQEAVASPVSDLLKTECSISSDDSLGKLPHKLVGISDRMIDKLKEHDPEASVPKPKRKTSKRPKPDDDSTTAKIQHVLAAEKEDDNADNRHKPPIQEDAKRGSETAVLGPKRKKTSKRLKQGEDKNISSDDSLGKLPHKRKASKRPKPNGDSTAKIQHVMAPDEKDSDPVLPRVQTDTRQRPEEAASLRPRLGVSKARDSVGGSDPTVSKKTSSVGKSVSLEKTEGPAAWKLSSLFK